MWKVSIVQRVKWKHVEGEYTSEITAKFETIENARRFANLALQGCARTTVTITYTESNCKEEEEKED